MTEERNKPMLSQASTTDVGPDRGAVPRLSAAWDKQLFRTEDPRAMGQMIINRFGVTQEHVDFLIDLGSKQRLLEFCRTNKGGNPCLDITELTSEELITRLQNSTRESVGYLQSLAEEGSRRKLLKLREEVIAFDEQHGTITSGFMSEQAYQIKAAEKPELFVNPEHAVHGVKHRSSLTETVRESFRAAVGILRESGRNPEVAVFVDLGSGAGKPALIAGSPSYHFPFRQVYGVDYYREAIELANKNLDAFNKSQPDELKIPLGKVNFVWADAAEWRSFGGITVVYSYNSFDREIMTEAEQNMRTHGGSCVFIYDKPLHKDIFDDKGWEQRHEITHRSDEDKRVAIYSYNL